MTARAGTMLSHYRLLEKLGEGGMGVVWRAEDTVLSRAVAIKVLPSSLSLDEARRKLFLDEARHAASVGDSHIVHIYDLGHSADIDFIVMELVDGRTLDQLIGGRPLPVQKVARWGEQIARGLSRAHRKMLLHRDLKPANIMISEDGEVKIVDFGIAALLPTSRSTRDTTVTVEPAGAEDERRIVGTLPYMSPEQVRGERLDARSDIFSLGVVLYEMTTGKRPFSGRSPADVAAEVLACRPAPPHSIVPEVPVDLERIVLKALSGDRAERYQTVDDLAIDLKRLGRELDSGESLSFASHETKRPLSAFSKWALGLAIAAALVTVGGFLLWPRVRLGGPETARTILVEPLEVRGAVGDEAYLGHALAEAIAINLAQAKDARVLATPESLNAQSSPSQRARALGAGRVLTGTITKSGGSLQVRATLLESRENRILWGTQEAVTPGGISQFAAIAAREVAKAMNLTVAESYEYFRYVSGSAAMAGSPLLAQTLGAVRHHDVVRGDSLTRELLREFPSEPDAHVLRIVVMQDSLNVAGTPEMQRAFLAAVDDLERVDRAHPLVPLLRVQQSEPGSPSVDQQREILTRLLERTDLTPAFRAHVLRTRAVRYALGFPDREAAAIRDVNESIRLDPGNTYGYNYAVRVLGRARRFAEAQDRAIQAFALESSAPLAQLCSRVFMEAGRDDLALFWARKAAATEPRRPSVVANLGLALSRSGFHQDALATIRELCSIRPSRENRLALATELALLGRHEEARAEGQAASAMARAPDSAASLEEARYLAVMGDTQSALNALRQILADNQQPGLLADPAFAMIRATAGFRALSADVARTSP